MIPSLLRPAALKARRQYVATMFQVMGHALEAISRTDPVVRKEVADLPENFVFEMTVLPKGPSLRIRHLGQGQLAYLPDPEPPEKIDLSIRFKHIAHAFLVLSFQEKTAIAFAHDRMLVDGDIGYAVRMTRVLNRLEAFILPGVIARRAVKEYPADLGLIDKLTGALRIYRRVAMSLVKELNPL